MYTTRYTKTVLPAFFVFDVVGVALAFWGAYYFKTGSIFVPLDRPYAALFGVAIMAWVVASILFRSYKVRRTFFLFNNLSTTLVALVVFIGIYTTYIVGGKHYEISRLFHVYFLSSASILMIATNVVRFKYVYAYRSKGGNILHSLLLVPEKPKHFNRERIENDLQHLGYKIIETIRTCGSNTFSDLRQVLTSQHVEVLFVLDPFVMNLDMDALADVCDDHGIRMKLLTNFSEQMGKRMGLDSVAGFPVLDIRHEPLLFLHNRIIKRGIDIVMALLSIIFVLSWLPIVVKIAQILSYPGPLLFRQERVGRDNRIFNLYKFRSMYHNPETAQKALRGEAEKTSPTDQRIPWFGRLLRRTNLDEYPQFINVLFGSMSVVGPRPHMKGEDEELANVIPKYRVRRFVKPGITGWAQINGYRGGTDDMEAMKKRTEYDIYYLENWSLWLDIKIIAITIWQMVTFSIPKAY